MSVSFLATVSLVACHGGPAEHFAVYAEELTKRGYEVQIHAGEEAIKKFQDRGIKTSSSFSLAQLTVEEQDRLAQTIAKACSTASVVITDVGNIFNVKIHKALDLQATQIPHLAYYDNPEPFVPGGYSATAAEVMNVAEGVIFANAALSNAKIYSAIGTEVDLAGKKRFGIGYYPVNPAVRIRERRLTDQTEVRSTFLAENGIEDHGQKLLIYFGGNNEEYFTKAFPAFLSFVEESSQAGLLQNVILVIKQHPAAKEKNRDGQQIDVLLKELNTSVNLPKIFIANLESDRAMVLADMALYYQTSMGPQFVLAGIPTVQIGHATYEDILVRNGLAPTVTDVTAFAHELENLGKTRNLSEDALMRDLGINPNWLDQLEHSLR